ncbi:MAG: hypothetical protein CMP81_14420 [Fulvimarina sp.]|nr:hypothetical protein [Fulvimarina sp.]
MGGSKFIPIVVALVVGLFIGWLLGPDVDDVSENVNKDIASLRAPIEATQTDVQAVSTKVDETNQTVSGALAEMKTQLDQLGQTVETRTSQIAEAVAPQPDQNADATSQGIADLKAEITKLQESVSGLSAGGQSGSSGGDMASLVQSVGPTGAILVGGQSAIFGSGRVAVSEVSDGSAMIAAGDGEAQEVQSGASLDVGDGCSVTLSGVASGAAFLTSEGCEGGSGQAAASGSPEAGQQAAATAGGQQQDSQSQGGQQAPATGQNAGQGAAAAAATGEAAGQASNEGQAAQQDEGSQQAAASGNTGGGTSTPVGGVATFGETRVFVSGVNENGAMLMVVGGKRQQVATGSSLDAGNGCSITLDSVADNAATMSASGCEGGGSGEAQQSGAAAPAEQAQPSSPASQQNGEQAAGGAEQAAAAPSAGSTGEQASDDSQQAAAPADQSTSGDAFSAGQTAVFGENRIFVSGVEENGATLFAVGGAGRQRVEVGQSVDVGNGCSVTLDGVENGSARLSAEGCEGGNDAAATEGAENAQPQDQAAAGSDAQPAAAAQEPAPAAGEAPAAQAAAPANDQAATGDQAAAQTPGAADGGAAAAASDEGISTGQTKTFGDHKVFLSAVSDRGATLYVVGAGRKEVASGQSLDLGDGCSVTVDGTDGSKAMLSATGC